jgi:hypothetical protein
MNIIAEEIFLGQIRHLGVGHRTYRKHCAGKEKTIPRAPPFVPSGLSKGGNSLRLARLRRSDWPDTPYVMQGQT